MADVPKLIPFSGTLQKDVDQPSSFGGLGQTGNTQVQLAQNRKIAELIEQRDLRDSVAGVTFNRSSNPTLNGVRDDALIGTTIPRNSWVMSTQRWIEGRTSDDGRKTPIQALVFRCNPSEVQWRMPQRSSEQKTRYGSVLHVWKDRPRNTYFDEPVLTFTFQSGNIMPIPTGTNAQLNGIAGGDADPGPEVPQGLANFYYFLDLVDDQKILSDGDGFGMTNFVYISYNSPVFPAITLAGLFTPDGVSWNESAADPLNLTWTASFTVYHTAPEMRGSDLVRAFRSAGFAGRGQIQGSNLSNADRESFAGAFSDPGLGADDLE